MFGLCRNERKIMDTQMQMTLGRLIAHLEQMPGTAQVANLTNPHSYRGYYADLGFEQLEGLRPAAELLAECYVAIDRVFAGPKGSDYAMTSQALLWVADRGKLGQQLMDVHVGGKLDTYETD
jgi:hypothetical protein